MSSWAETISNWFKDPSGNLSTSQVCTTALAAYGLYTIGSQVKSKLTFENLLKAIPGAANLANKALEAEVEGVVSDIFHPLVPKYEQVLSLPERRGNYSEILDKMKELRRFDASGDGKHFAYIYDPCEPGFKDFIKEAFDLFSHENGLNPTAFPALRKFEVDIAQMAANLFNGPETTVGSVTSGGTESILCAIKAYRERARDIWPHIIAPEVVIPVTGHVAFPKAGHMFDVTFRFVPLNADCTVNLKEYEKAINKNTILLVASAPQYPHGLIDPIEEIAKFCHQKSRVLPLHIDACVGGFILPFLERLGENIPHWDYRVPEVTSISADVHKYGYAAKGASTLTFRDSTLRKYQFWSFTTWPGGLFMSPSLLGTRGGGPIAAAWAALQGLGVEGYTTIASKVRDTRAEFAQGINSIPDLKVIGFEQGLAHGPILAFYSTNPSLNVLAIADIMETYGWALERQQLPSCCHMTIMPSHFGKVSRFLEDLEKAVNYTKEHPELNQEGSAAMYGMVAKIKMPSIVRDFLLEFQSQLLSKDKYNNEVATIPPPTARGGIGSVDELLANHIQSIEEECKLN